MTSSDSDSSNGRTLARVETELGETRRDLSYLQKMVTAHIDECVSRRETDTRATIASIRSWNRWILGLVLASAATLVLAGGSWALTTWRVRSLGETQQRILPELDYVGRQLEEVVLAGREGRIARIVSRRSFATLSREDEGR